MHYNWVAACGGKEEPFTGRDGKRYIYMWNGVSAANPPAGHRSEHAYYCITDDLFLTNEECAGRVWPE